MNEAIRMSMSLQQLTSWRVEQKVLQVGVLVSQRVTQTEPTPEDPERNP